MDGAECEHRWMPIYFTDFGSNVPMYTETDGCSICKSMRIRPSEAFLKGLEESKKQVVEVMINHHHYKGS